MVPYPYKKPYYWGLLVYAAFILFSIIFYKERCIFIDSAYYLFFQVKDNTFFIPHNRYSTILVQALPMLARKLEMPLNTVVFLTSFGRELLFLICYLVCGFGFKSYRMGLVLLLSGLLLVTETFYFQFELPQGIALVAVLFAFWDSGIKLNIVVKCLLSIPLLFFITFSHPLVFFVFSFTAAFLLFSGQKAKDIFTLTALYVIMLIVRFCFFSDPYEANSMASFQAIRDALGNFFNLYSNKQFLADCLNKYYWFVILLISTFIIYANQRKWIKLVIFTLACIGYLLIVNLSFPGDFMISFHMENMYLPLSVFLALPFVFDILPVQKFRTIGRVVLVMVCLVGLTRICMAHQRFTARLNWERNFLDANPGKKIIAKSDFPPRDIMSLPWGSVYEFWILSTIEDHKTASVIFIDNPDELKDVMNEPKMFLTLWGGYYHYNELPSKYFILKDTTSTYQVLH